MKKNRIIFFATLLAGIIFLIFGRVKYLDHNSRKENQKKQVGTYIFDISKTVLGPYQINAKEYEKLILVFYDNKEFEFNMIVPFINDIRGIWKSSGSGLEEWNNIYFDSWDYSTGITGEQFTQCCDSDSTFYFNGMTPRKGAVPIQKIWFRKVFTPIGAKVSGG